MSNNGARTPYWSTPEQSVECETTTLEHEQVIPAIPEITQKPILEVSSTNEDPLTNLVISYLLGEFELPKPSKNDILRAKRLSKEMPDIVGELLDDFVWEILQDYRDDPAFERLLEGLVTKLVCRTADKPRQAILDCWNEPDTHSYNGIDHIQVERRATIVKVLFKWRNRAA